MVPQAAARPDAESSGRAAPRPSPNCAHRRRCRALFGRVAADDGSGHGAQTDRRRNRRHGVTGVSVPTVPKTTPVAAPVPTPVGATASFVTQTRTIVPFCLPAGTSWSKCTRQPWLKASRSRSSSRTGWLVSARGLKPDAAPGGCVSSWTTTTGACRHDGIRRRARTWPAAGGRRSRVGLPLQVPILGLRASAAPGHEVGAPRRI
jgi:hypothetical protein